MRQLFSIIALFVALSFCSYVRADDDTLPGTAFDPDRYRTLWEESPFAVATPVAVELQEYSLVGAAQFDGVSYCSVIDKQNQDHFVVTSNAPAHGLALLSLVRGQTLDSTFATFQKSGAILKLKLETNAPPGMPSVVPPIPVAQNSNPAGILTPGYSGVRRRPPHVRIIAPPVYVPIPPSPQ